MNTQKPCWIVCLECDGLGKCTPKHHPKVLLRRQKAVEYFQRQNPSEVIPEKLKEKIYKCTRCEGAGVVESEKHLIPDSQKLPRVAIVGGGIGGVALAVACLHRGIPFTLYERDESFDARSQGYGLTLQQARKALEGFGITSLEKGLVSTRHVVHNPEGQILGEWGTRNWEHKSSKVSIDNSEKMVSPKTNIHIARQSLRLAFLEQLNGSDSVQWGHQLVDFKQKEAKIVELNFDVNGEAKIATVDLLVGADGVRSSVRNLLLREANPPLEYLGCIVILGICPLELLSHVNSPLLDSKTVFQTANGNERIYVMPFDSKTVMWQLSFPISEEEAKEMSSNGAVALKKEAIKRTKWHWPIPEMVRATEESLISGYPAYDRKLLDAEMFEDKESVTLLGDAAHPMSPFKGQGANQALLDALSLARIIYKNCNASSDWKKIGLKLSVLNEFESEMINRSSNKVIESAEAASFLHSEVVLREGNHPRGQ